MSQHVFSSGLLRKGILWYFLSFFVKFPRHWQLNQLRLNTAGIESHTLRQGHANVAPWQKRTPETRKTAKNSKNLQKSSKICKVSSQNPRTAHGCCSASQTLGGNAWQAGSWIFLVECKASAMLKKTHKIYQNILKNWRKIGRKNMYQKPFWHTLRRESNPGLLSEGRGAADRQKC